MCCLCVAYLAICTASKGIVAVLTGVANVLLMCCQAAVKVLLTYVYGCAHSVARHGCLGPLYGLLLQVSLP